MKKYFYSHIVEVESLFLELEKFGFSEQEKAHLITLIDSSLHHAVLDAILSELSGGDKKIFLEHMAAGDEGKIWKFLLGKVENIEDKIRRAAEELKGELHKDMKETRGKG